MRIWHNLRLELVSDLPPEFHNNGSANSAFGDQSREAVIARDDGRWTPILCGANAVAVSADRLEPGEHDGDNLRDLPLSTASDRRPN